MVSRRDQIALNARGAIGIVNVVLWVKLLSHDNKYLPAQPEGLLKITEVDLDGHVVKAVFSQDGERPFVELGGPGACRRLEFVVKGRDRA